MVADNTGIYEIRNIQNGNRYIGSATRIDGRWRDHKRSLGRNNHHAIALQRAWNKYGESVFEFSKLLICSKQNLIMYEQAFFDFYKPEYNCAPIAGSQLGYKHSEESRKRMSDSRQRDFSPMTGKAHSAETKAKISASRKGKGGGPRTPERLAKIGAAHRGRVKSPEHRAKIAATLTGHKQSAEQIEKRMSKIRSLSSEQVLSIRADFKGGKKINRIAVGMGIQRSIVSAIIQNKTYNWVA